MTSRCARALASEGVTVWVVNRTLARAEELAGEIGGRATSLDAFRDRPEPVEALVSATGASDPVLDRPALERIAAQTPSGEPPLVVDMAIPPDIDPEDAARAGLERIGMNQVIAIAEENRRERLIELADARTLVDAALDDLRQRIIERHLSPVLAALQRRYRRTALEGVERLLRRELKGLGESEREAVTRWAETLARRFAHIPTAGLRAIAQEGGNQAVEVFLRGLGEELARELRADASPKKEAPHLAQDGADGP
jgi:glutamyl-tRNA reductase